MSDQGNNSSVSIGGNVTGASVVTGDCNRVTTLTQVQPPAAAEVDVVAEITALRGVVEKMAVTDRGKRALADASDAAAEPAGQGGGGKRAGARGEGVQGGSGLHGERGQDQGARGADRGVGRPGCQCRAGAAELTM